jgi:hypothetical protein
MGTPARGSGKPSKGGSVNAMGHADECIVISSSQP